MTDEKKPLHYSPFTAFVGYEQGKNTLNRHDEAESYGSYLFGSAFDMPDGDTKTNWSSYFGGRTCIRLFSRGILGATFYTFANHAIPNQLRGYDKDMENLGSFAKYPLRYVAKFFDTAYGVPIEFYIRKIAPVAEADKMVENALWFRRKNSFANPFGHMGRSIGAEVTAMSFDFAMGSVGDATGRYIATTIDPNVDKKWLKDGHIDGKELGKELAAEAWKIFSKNQGEDWAAALPYVFQMKYQRQAINNLYPGFKFTSDRGLNGGSWLVDREGRITDSYSKAGAIDLQGRFTLYNWYTLMYRDLYDTLADKFTGLTKHKEEGKKESILPTHFDPLHTPVDWAGKGIRYVAKSFIKSAIYMTPAVPFFWITRTPQTKYKGVGIYLDPHDRMQGGVVQMPNGSPYSFADSNPEFYSASGYTLHPNDVLNLNGRPLPHSEIGYGFDPFAQEHTRGAFDAGIAPFGSICYKTGDVLFKGLKSVGIAQRENKRINKQFVHDWTNASLSYTPYMIAKAETALRWDRPLMDKAIYRFIDGISSLSLPEMTGGLSDIREQIMHPPTNRKIEQVEQEEALREQREKEAAEQAEKEKSPETKVADTQGQGVIKKSTAEKTAKANPAADAAWQEHFKHESGAPQGVTIH